MAEVNFLIPALLALITIVGAWLLLRSRRRRILSLRWPRDLKMRRLHYFAEIYLQAQGFEVVHSAWDRASFQRDERAILLFFHTRNYSLRPIQLADFAREYLDWKHKYVVTQLPVDPQFIAAAAQAGIGVIRPAGLAELADPDRELQKLR